MLRASRAFAVFAVLLPSVALAAGTLETRVREAAGALSSLQAYFLTCEDAAERAAALQGVLARAAWLEQVGGLKTARDDALWALAHWERLGSRPVGAAPRQVGTLHHGFLADGSGTVLCEAAARRARPGELPAALAPFEGRLACLLVRNTSSRAVQVLGPPFAEFHRTEGRVAVCAPGELPAALRSRDLGTFFTWPERLAPGDEFQVLVLLPEKPPPLAALGVDLRAGFPTSRDGPRGVRVVFPAAADPEGFAGARAQAARQEAELAEARQKRLAEIKKTAPKAAAPPAPAPPPPRVAESEKEPPAVGVVEPSGAESLVQVRLYRGQKFRPGQVFRVRKDGSWCGKVAMPEAVLGEGEKTIFWARILEGRREALAGGTLHTEE